MGIPINQPASPAATHAGLPVGAMTVAEIAHTAGVTPHVVRHYTRIGLLLPRRDQHNGYKLFNLSDLNRLLFIRRAKLLGYTLADIRSILEEARQGDSPCPRVRQIIRKRIAENRRVLAGLLKLQERMEKALAAWEKLPDGQPDGDSVCYLIDSMMSESDPEEQTLCGGNNMNIAIIATKGCSHRPRLEQQLKDLGCNYEVLYVEENPELVEKYAIRHSPNLLVDGKIVCRHQPSEAELKTLLDL